MSAHTCVIYNPAAGRGRATWAVRRLRRRFVGVEFRPTARPGHAAELARRAADDGFARVVAAGGDGTAHEVANGLLTGGRPDVVFATWPAGSMNDYAYACGLDRWPEVTGPLAVVSADVLRLTCDGVERYAINGVGVGFNGAVTVESRRLHRLRGNALYASAFLLAAARRYTTPVTRVELDGVTTVGPLLALSVSVGQREGGFRLFPHAKLGDGQAETLRVGRVLRVELPRHLPTLLKGRLPEHPEVATGRCRVGMVQSDEGVSIHADGEMIRRTEDGPTNLRIELLTNMLRVEVDPTRSPA
jgi:diacylglycerol kinase family enzyme